MLLNKLNVINSQGSSLNLPLEDNSEGFTVKEIRGLDPVKATLVSSSFANIDGEQYHSSRRETRNIIIKLGLDPDYALYSVYDLREQLYNFFMPSTQVLLKFNLFDKFSENVIKQNLDLEIVGRIETFEQDMFVKEPTVDISLICFDPNFIDPDPVIFEGMSVNDATETILTYEGSIETGVIFTLFPDRSMWSFEIEHVLPDGEFRSLFFEYQLEPGDKVEISSIKGDKYVLLIRDFVESLILYALGPDSSWLEIFPGNNSLSIQADGAPVPFSIEYTNKYGGL